ncbi:MAG TPA: DUF5665 domain-containing protein [Patescibacteria group bacterium]|nr:DUF5665 domain-containing protein [Patescibacteria group bacterium]
MAESKNLSDKEYMELGKKLQQFYDSGYINKKQAILFTFYKGIAAGFGGLVGGTILIALILWILSLFSNVPLADRIVNELQHILHTK